MDVAEEQMGAYRDDVLARREREDALASERAIERERENERAAITRTARVASLRRNARAILVTSVVGTAAAFLVTRAASRSTGSGIVVGMMCALSLISLFHLHRREDGGIWRRWAWTIAVLAPVVGPIFYAALFEGLEPQPESLRASTNHYRSHAHRMQDR